MLFLGGSQGAGGGPGGPKKVRNIHQGIPGTPGTGGSPGSPGPLEGFMGSKSAQNLSLMQNLLSDYVGYKLNLCISGSPGSRKDDRVSTNRPRQDVA